MNLPFKNQGFLSLIFLTFSVFGSKDIEFKKKILISQAVLNLCKKFEKAEGFLAGTLVKTEDGYRSIEHLAVGDSVISFDFDGKSCQSKIVQISKKTIKGFVALQIGEKTVCAGPDQKFFLPEKGDWIKAKNIALSNRFLIKSQEVSSALEIKFCNQTTDVYSISLDEHHNFCITESDILVHNFAPAVVAGVTIAFDGAGAEIVSIFCSVGVCGFFYKIFGWENNDRRSNEPVRQSEPCQPCRKIEEEPKDRGIDCAYPAKGPEIPLITADPIKVGNDSGLFIFPIPEKVATDFLPGPVQNTPKMEDLVFFDGPRAENTKKLLSETPLGEKLRGKVEKTHIINDGQPVYKVVEKIKELGLNKGDHFYIDKESYKEIEVFDGANSTSKHKKVINTDGTINHDKTERAKGREFGKGKK